MQEELTELKELQKTLSMSWPSPQDYNEALQNPAYSFSDPLLASGQTELDNLGLPRPRSGMFASVYKVHSDNSDWAVRCFLQFKPDQVSRYVQIKDTLRRASLPCIVPFDLQEEGIRVSGQSFPMLKMQWCQGDTLNYWLAKNLRNKPALEDFLESWRQTLKALSSAGIAHGDLQHGNILVQDGQIKLVDYDGVYIPQFQGMPATELGHRSYQHPKRNESHFGPYLDNFSGWLIYLSVLISGCDPHVWQDFEGGDECLLFRRQDLDNPLESELFHVLEHHRNPQIREGSRTLRYLLTLPPENVPGLEAPVAVPDDLPDLDSVISDLPDWIMTDEGRSSGAYAAFAPTAPEGKRIMRRRRRSGRPFSANSSEQTVSGRWLYDEHGLSFTPDTEANAATKPNRSASSASPSSFHSPLLDTYTSSPAPYRNIEGNLRSPMLDDYSSSSDKPGYLFERKETINFPVPLKLLATVLFIACLLGLMTPRMTAEQIWPEGQYYRLLDGRVAMETGDYAKAEDSFKLGLEELPKMKDKRVPVDLAYLYDNLGKLHYAQEQYSSAIEDFKQSLLAWKNYTGDKTTDYADVLIESAQTLAKIGQLTSAEQAYQRVIQIYQSNGFVPEDPAFKSLVEEYVAVLKQDHKDKEAAEAEAMLPKEVEPVPENGTENNQAETKLKPAASPPKQLIKPHPHRK